MMQRQPSATAAGSQEPVSATKGSVFRGPAGPAETDTSDCTPQVLARIPSLAGDLPDDDPLGDEGGQSRRLGSRASLTILAAVGGALFLLALWGFVFDRNKSKDEGGGTVSTQEPFRPELPAPNAPEAPRWTGLPSSSEPRASGPQGPISAEARPVPPDAAAAGGAPWPGFSGQGSQRDPRSWTLSQGSSAPASPAWTGQDANRSDPVPDWTTHPYPSTSDRTQPPVWDISPGTRPVGSVAGAARPEVSSGDAAATRSAVNPVYRDDRDPAPAAPAAYTDPALGGSRWPAVDRGPMEPAPSVAGSSNRPVSLAQRPPLDRQLPSPPSAVSRDVPGGGWNWNVPTDSRRPGAPSAGSDAQRGLWDGGQARPEAGWPLGSPGASDYRGPASGGAFAAPSPGAQGGYGSVPNGYAWPAFGVNASGGAAYGAGQSAPAASPTPPTNPYHNLLPMYQAPPSNQPQMLAMPTMGASPSGTLPGWPQATGQGPVPGGFANPAPNYGNPASPAQPTHNYGSPAAPWGSSTRGPGGGSYPPSYSLPVAR